MTGILTTALVIIVNVTAAVGLLYAVVRHKPKPRTYAEKPTHTVTRPTVTRVILGGLLAGPIGALAGYAWRKKERVPDSE